MKFFSLLVVFWVLEPSIFVFASMFAFLAVWTLLENRTVSTFLVRRG